MYTIPIVIHYQGMMLTGFAKPVADSGTNLFPLKIYIKGWCIGFLNKKNNKWIMDQPIDPKFVESLGKYIHRYIGTKQ